MAYFHQPAMPTVPLDATPLQRRAMFEAYVASVRTSNPHLNAGRGLFGWLSHLFRNEHAHH